VFEFGSRGAIEPDRIALTHRRAHFDETVGPAGHNADGIEAAQTVSST
jgi:hypothetical protein